MMIYVIGVPAVFLAAALFWYYFFAKREKKLLDVLQNMIDRANEDDFKRTDISETKFSLLENSMKRYLEDSRVDRESQKKQKNSIQELISDIAHQTLTPVSNLKLYTQLLVESENNTEKRGEEEKELVDTICEQTDKLDFLIQSLVKLSRMETGIIAVKPRKSSISELLQGAVSEYRQKAQDRDIELETEETDLTAFFDKKWTGEALGNLIDNALKYTAPGGHVGLSVQKYSFFVRIDVADNGAGIEQEEIPKIFSRFYRSFSSADIPGVGIGLYLAREIIEAQRGYLKVESMKGVGSVFSVFLPVSGVSNKNNS